MATQPQRPYLAPSEFRIFFVLSLRNPLTIREIGHDLAHRYPDFRQGYSTLATILQRLISKGYVSQGEPGSTTAFLFHPTLPLDDVVRSHVEHFLDDHLLVEPAEIRTVVEVAAGKLTRRAQPS